ncbi:MAG: iron-containing alcohol dehydrogenase, partial [Succinivibrio sp.]
MHPFELYLPTRLIFGKGSISRLPDVLSGHQNILLAYGGGSIKKIGLYDEVKKLLAGKNVFELSGIAPNPKVG